MSRGMVPMAAWTVALGNQEMATKTFSLTFRLARTTATKDAQKRAASPQAITTRAPK